MNAVIIICLINALPAGSLATLQEPTLETANVRIVSHPPVDGANQHYTCHRDPLMPDPLVKLPIGSIAPEGWLRHQLEAMRDGMVGRLPELSKWCDAKVSAWRSPKGEGEYGWEELPYWLRGFTNLAYVLGDEKLIKEARGWIDAILTGQEEDGYFGPRTNKEKLDLWPNMLVLNVMQTHYEATGEPRVLDFMTRYFRWQASLEPVRLFPGSWQKIRAGDNLESVLWLYNRTGDEFLLDLARLIHERTVRWDLKVASWHGVNICQGYREPAIYYVVSQDRSDLDASERDYQQVMTLYGQAPGGMFGADENCREGYYGSRQGAETCSMVEFMRSFEMLLGITGDPLQADRCEEVAFNDLPASMPPDLRGLHYLTAPNMVQLDRSDKSPGLQNGGCMLAFDPHLYRCCQHNVGMGWPDFAEHLWMATRDNGLAAVLYAASRVEAKVAGGVEVKIAETTDYPFDELVGLTISTPSPVRFPLYLRVPGWCERAAVKVNGQAMPAPTRPHSYVRLEREWHEGDRVELQLPMDLKVVRWRTNHDAISIARGPLWYSLKIGESWLRSGGTDEWPGYEVLPDSAWNYGLVLDDRDPGGSLRVETEDGPPADQPFTPDAAPITLTAQARRIPNWTLDSKGLIHELQGSPVRSGEPLETVKLIPMGCARLRVSMFPTIGEGPDAREWVTPPPPRHEASECWDVIYALSDGEIPTSSSDYATPRFTWVPKRGTTEWVTYRFEKPRVISWSDVYWFEDAGIGYCRVPQSWKLLYRDGEAWREVASASGYGTERDRFNRVTFDPVSTSELKIVAEFRPASSAGILEWRVGGPRD